MQPGRDQESFDKQFVRNWLETQPWDKTPPAPRLPAERGHRHTPAICRKRMNCSPGSDGASESLVAVTA